MFEAQDLYMCVDVEHFQTMKELNHQFQVPVRCHSGLAVEGHHFWSLNISLWVWPNSYLISHRWYHGKARQESIHFVALLSYKQNSRCSFFISQTCIYTTSNPKQDKIFTVSMSIKNQGARPFDRSCEDNIFKRSSGITSFNMTPFQYLVGHDEKMWGRNGYHLECEPCFYRLMTSPFLALANQKIRLIHNQAGVHYFWWLCPSGINGDSYARNDQTYNDWHIHSLDVGESLLDSSTVD